MLSGTGALVVITAVIIGVLLCVIAWDRIDAFLRPTGPIIASLVVAIYGAAALLMAAPADLLIDGPGSRSAFWTTLLIALAVALLMARRFRPRWPEPPFAVAGRALILLACCSGAKYVAHLVGFPVGRFWPAAAVSLAALMLTAAVFEFIRRPGVLHLVVRAFAVLSTAGLVAAWATTNHVPVYADPRTATPRTLWVMLLVEPLGALAALLLLIAMVRHFAPSVLPDSKRTPAAGEIWNAFVMFEEDGGEGKDRPVLVLSSAGGQASILKITSQDKSRFPDYLPLPRNRCRAVLAKDSWLELKPLPLATESFRSYRGRCPSWVLTEVRRRELLPAGSGDVMGKSK
jgi:MFS family permease